MANQRRILSVVLTAMAMIGLCTMLCPAQEKRAELKRDYNVKPVPFSEVRVGDDFWTPRLETSRKVTIPYAFDKCEETGRIRNFEKAAGLKEGRHEGIYFDDSDSRWMGVFISLTNTFDLCNIHIVFPYKHCAYRKLSTSPSRFLELCSRCSSRPNLQFCRTQFYGWIWRILADVGLTISKYVTPLPALYPEPPG